MADHQFDLIILGTGPAGITAALYGQRLGLNTVVFGDIPGGNVYMIENLLNYPGFIDGIPGTQFGVAAFQQAQNEGAHFTMTRLNCLVYRDKVFAGTDANDDQFTAPCAIVATGRVPKRLAVSNATIKGIHFCSLCDGPLFRGADAILAVVGSDNTAAQHALTLSRIAQRVILVCRSRHLLMDAAHENLIRKQKNIDLLIGAQVTDYKGLDLIEGITVTTGENDEKEIGVDGVFLAIGWRPNTKMLELEVEKTSDGYLKTDPRLMTTLPGLFAAGDVRDTDMSQVLTACADGARAAKYAAEYLETLTQS